MKKKQLDDLSERLNKAISPGSRKVQATAKILEQVEPLPIIQKPTEAETFTTRREDFPEREFAFIGKTPVRQQFLTPQCASSDSMTASPSRIPEPVENTSADGSKVANFEASEDQMGTLANSGTVPMFAMVKGELRVPHTINDSLFPTLDPVAAMVYYRLYRLSHGFGRDTCTVGFAKLALTVNISKNTAQRAIQTLERRLLVEHLSSVFGGKEKGNTYRVNLPSTLPSSGRVPSLGNVANSATVPNSDISKHDDDFKKKSSSKGEDHRTPVEKHSDDNGGHLKRIQSVYTQLTRNHWKQTDTQVYLENKISQIPSQKVIAVMEAVAFRAGKVRSFNYFIQEILDISNPSSRGRAYQKKALAAIVKRVLEAHRGRSGYSYEIDLPQDVKAVCAREGVVFDNDLLNALVR